LFVTTNSRLAEVSRQFFYQEATPGAVAPCLTDYALTNLLWLKRPLQAPDLPRKRIIADCYAATQPDEHLWQLYLQEIDKLEQLGQATADDYYLLRYSLEAKETLMELTLGEEEAFTQGTVPEILELVRSRMQADLFSKLESETRARKEAEEQVKTSEVREIERRSRIKTHAQHYARVIAQGVKYGALFFLLIAVISTFPWNFPVVATSPFRYGISLIQIALLVLSVANLMYGTTLESYIRKAEVALSQCIYKRLLTLVEP